MNISNKILIVIAIMLMVTESIVVFHLQVNQRDNENWTGPYFSAASNLKLFGGFRIDEQEVIRYKELSPREQYQYQFSHSENTVHYNHNPVGFAYIIAAAKTIFFPFGDGMALVMLQVLVHIVLCCLLLYKVNNRTFTVFFCIVYALNPIIINFVVLNYYYFWQCIPGFVILYLITEQKPSVWIGFLLMVLLTFSTLSRPTIIFLSFFTLLLYFKAYSPWVATVNLLLAGILFVSINQPTEKNIWHTIYVGIAAYPNPYIAHLSDNEAYDLYQKETGTELNASVGGNYYDKKVIDQYQEITKTKVLEIIRTNPLLFIRNAALNTLQCFSPGYFNLNILLINLIMAAGGLLFFIFLWLTRQWIIILCILLYAGSFCLYYPPIQAYLYGAYILSAIGFYSILSHYFPGKFPTLNLRFMQKTAV